MEDFIHLHVHTHYSILDGQSKVANLVKKAVGDGMRGMAITDHGVMYGVVDFYRAAKAAGIKPVLGCEVYVAPGSRFDKEAVGSGDDRYYLSLIHISEPTRPGTVSRMPSSA